MKGYHFLYAMRDATHEKNILGSLFLCCSSVGTGGMHKRDVSC